MQGPMKPNQNPFKRRGVRVYDPTPDITRVIQQTVKQDLEDPEDQGQPTPENRLKKYGQSAEAYDG